MAYTITGLTVTVERDNFEQGCSGHSDVRHIQLTLTADTIEELLVLLKQVIYFEQYVVNAQNHSELLFSRMEDERGYRATPNQIKKWQECKLDLWYCAYCVKINETKPVDLLTLLPGSPLK